MEDQTVQREKIEGSREQGDDGGKADWKNECSFSSLLKHSCLLCWSSSRDTDVIEMDERVLTKAAEIRELENAVTVENQEFEEQQSDRKELEDTLVKLDKHKDKLIQQIKATRQHCYEESQKILSLQAEEVQKESQVEEYERELARARWRLKKLREEVKQAKMKVEEAGERNTPLKDSIRQSYEEILQEEHTLCSLSGGVASPESQVEGSTSPADTTEEDPLPMRPWGRSQSLPAYADLIMGADGLTFCNNLAGTREEDDSGTSSPKDMDRSDTEEDPDEIHSKEREEGSAFDPKPLSQLDFYQDNPFTHCQTDHDLFSEDMFSKTESSDAFASDPFKGSNPFAADILFPEAPMSTTGGVEIVDEDADTSLSCAENKASTGTQCFESEFPDEDSDIEISYSREDLESAAAGNEFCGFKPIQSSSEELVQVWKSQGQHSVESDPNGYELEVCPASPPSDTEDNYTASLAGGYTVEAIGPQEGSDPAWLIHPHSEPSQLEQDWTDGISPTLPGDSSLIMLTKDISDIKDKPLHPTTTKNMSDSQNPVGLESKEFDLDETSLDLNYEAVSQPSFDPYGFKLSPEHSGHILLEPDESELSPEPVEGVTSFDPTASSSLPHELNFDPYGFDTTASLMVRDSDPYGFKLSPEEENQEVLDMCGYDNLEDVGLCSDENKEQIENIPFMSQEESKTQTCENQEVIKNIDHSFQNLPDDKNGGKHKVTQPSGYENNELVVDFLDFSSHENQEVLDSCPAVSKQTLEEPLICENQEVVETCHHGNQEQLSFSHPENQEVLDFDCHENQALLEFCKDENQEFLGNQEVLDLFDKESLPKENNNQVTAEPEPNLRSTNDSSESDPASEDLQQLELSNINIRPVNTPNNGSPATLNKTLSNMASNQDFSISTTQTSRSLLEGDLGSVFGAGGYIGCPDVADDLEPLDRRQDKTVPEPEQPVRPVRPPRPSLRIKAKPQSYNIDLK
uniref:Epidermal growth factor receptor pathway substrate 15 n=1 Tax=Iconisemion striatum TaxID=60296 RepID=A0A1A7Z312_9TELE